MPTPLAPPSHVFTRALDHRLEEIATLAEALAQWASSARVPPAAVHAVNLMLDELITNVVVHASPASPRGEILVDVRLSPGQLDVRLRDHAAAHDPLTAPEPDLACGIEDRAVGGLGVHFVRRLADEVSYARTHENGRAVNLVHIVKRFSPAR